MRTLLNKAQQALKDNDDYFLPESFKKFTVHIFRLFSLNIQLEDLTESFTEILDKISAQDLYINKSSNSEHDKKSTNSEIFSEMEIEYSTLQSDVTYSRNTHPMFLQNTVPTLRKISKKRRERFENPNKPYYLLLPNVMIPIQKLIQILNPDIQSICSA